MANSCCRCAVQSIVPGVAADRAADGGPAHRRPQDFRKGPQAMEGRAKGRGENVRLDLASHVVPACTEAQVDMRVI